MHSKVVNCVLRGSAVLVQMTNQDLTSPIAAVPSVQVVPAAVVAELVRIVELVEVVRPVVAMGLEVPLESQNSVTD